QAVNGDELAKPFFIFWLLNFGLWVPIVLTLFGLAVRQLSETGTPKKIAPNAAFLLSALSIFLLAYLVRLAPWGWDNMKVLIWAYFLVLPFLWSDLLAKWPATARIVVCAALFGSGFVSLFGGLAVGNYGFAGRAE